MDNEFELVAELNSITDNKGFLDIQGFIDKTTDGVVPSNRDFYFEVFYNENPEVLVTTSNSVTIRHMARSDPMLILESDKDLIFGEGYSILTLAGAGFIPNSRLVVKVLRYIEDAMPTVMETKSIVSDADGKISIDAHENHTYAGPSVGIRNFYAEVMYEEEPTIYKSNEVPVQHISEPKPQ